MPVVHAQHRSCVAQRVHDELAAYKPRVAQHILAFGDDRAPVLRCAGIDGEDAPARGVVAQHIEGVAVAADNLEVGAQLAHDRNRFPAEPGAGIAVQALDVQAPLVGAGRFRVFRAENSRDPKAWRGLEDWLGLEPIKVKIVDKRRLGLTRVASKNFEVLLSLLEDACPAVPNGTAPLGY